MNEQLIKITLVVLIIVYFFLILIAAMKTAKITFREILGYFRLKYTKPVITVTDEAHTKVNKNWFDKFDDKMIYSNTKQKAEEIMKKHIDPDFEVKGIDSLFQESKFKRFTKPELGEPWKTHDFFQWENKRPKVDLEKFRSKVLEISKAYNQKPLDIKQHGGFRVAKAHCTHCKADFYRFNGKLKVGLWIVTGYEKPSEREQIIDKIYKGIMEGYEVDQIIENYSENDSPVFAKVTTQFQDGQIIYLEGHKHFFNANGYEKYKKYLEVLF